MIDFESRRKTNTQELLKYFRVLYDIPFSNYFEILGALYNYFYFRNKAEQKLKEYFGADITNQIIEIGLPIPKIYDFFYLNYLKGKITYFEGVEKYKSLIQLFRLETPAENDILCSFSKKDTHKFIGFLNFYNIFNINEVQISLNKKTNYKLYSKVILSKEMIALDQFVHKELITQLNFSSYNKIYYSFNSQREPASFSIDNLKETLASVYFHHKLKLLLFIYSRVNNYQNRLNSYHFDFNILFDNFENICFDIGLNPEIYLYETFKSFSINDKAMIFNSILDEFQIAKYFSYLKNMGILDEEEQKRIEDMRLAQYEKHFKEELVNL